jgi:ABC-type amino acid transport substrate-binding protein
MKRLFALAAIASAVALTACDDPRPAEPEVMDSPMEEPVAAAVEDVQAPVAATATTDTPPDNSTAPGEKRTSEESVRPDSETLFY